MSLILSVLASVMDSWLFCHCRNPSEEDFIICNIQSQVKTKVTSRQLKIFSVHASLPCLCLAHPCSPLRTATVETIPYWQAETPDKLQFPPCLRSELASVVLTSPKRCWEWEGAHPDAPHTLGLPLTAPQPLTESQNGRGWKGPLAII